MNKKPKPYGLAPNAWVIYERPTGETIVVREKDFGSECWVTGDEILETKDGICKIHHSYSPAGYFNYVREEDLRSQFY